MQRWLRNVPKSMMHMQTCGFANLNLLLLCHSRCCRRRRYLSSLIRVYSGMTDVSDLLREHKYFYIQVLKNQNWKFNFLTPLKVEEARRNLTKK